MNRRSFLCGIAALPALGIGVASIASAKSVRPAPLVSGKNMTASEVSERMREIALEAAEKAVNPPIILRELTDREIEAVASRGNKSTQRYAIEFIDVFEKNKHLLAAGEGWGGLF